MQLLVLYSEHLKDAFQQGFQQGFQEGFQQGKRQVIERILEFRFGSVDDELYLISE